MEVEVGTVVAVAEQRVRLSRKKKEVVVAEIAAVAVVEGLVLQAKEQLVKLEVVGIVDIVDLTKDLELEVGEVASWL